MGLCRQYTGTYKGGEVANGLKYAKSAGSAAQPVGLEAGRVGLAGPKPHLVAVSGRQGLHKALEGAHEHLGRAGAGAWGKVVGPRNGRRVACEVVVAAGCQDGVGGARAGHGGGGGAAQLLPSAGRADFQVARPHVASDGRQQRRVAADENRIVEGGGVNALSRAGLIRLPERTLRHGRQRGAQRTLSGKCPAGLLAQLAGCNHAERELAEAGGEVADADGHVGREGLESIEYLASTAVVVLLTAPTALSKDAFRLAIEEDRAGV